jgi:hypothetical protein
MLSSKYFASVDTTVLLSRKLHLANGDTGVMNKSEQLNNGEKSDVTTASLKAITTLYPSLEKRASTNHRVCLGVDDGLEVGWLDGCTEPVVFCFGLKVCVGA